MNRSFSLNYYYFEIVKVFSLKLYLITSTTIFFLRFLFICAKAIYRPKPSTFTSSFISPAVIVDFDYLTSAKVSWYLYETFQGSGIAIKPLCGTRPVT
jgi:hypothetical protein